VGRQKKSRAELILEYEDHERFWRMVRSNAEMDPERIDYYAELELAERHRKEQERKKRAALLPPLPESVLSLEEALGRLESVRRTGPEKWQARCPVHDDRNPSLLVAESQTRPGEPYFYCFRGCDFRLIREALIGNDRPGLQAQ
jgi:hypothetical protein